MDIKDQYGNRTGRSEDGKTLSHDGQSFIIGFEIVGGLKNIMKNTCEDMKFLIDEEGGVHLLLRSGDYESEVNGELVTRTFGVISRLKLKDGFKVAPGTKLTDEVGVEIVSNLKEEPFEIDLVHIYKNEKSEITRWEIYRDPDAGEIFCNLLEITQENIESFLQ